MHSLITKLFLHAYDHIIDFKQRTKVSTSVEMLCHFQSQNGSYHFIRTSFMFDSVLSNNLKSEKSNIFSHERAEVKQYLDKKLFWFFFMLYGSWNLQVFTRSAGYPVAIFLT